MKIYRFVVYENNKITVIEVWVLRNFAHKISHKLTFFNVKSIRRYKKNICHRADDDDDDTPTQKIDQFVVENGTLHITRRCGRLSSRTGFYSCMWFVYERYAFVLFFAFIKYARTVSAWIYVRCDGKAFVLKKWVWSAKPNTDELVVCVWVGVDCMYVR